MKDNAPVDFSRTRIVVLHKGAAVASTLCDPMGKWQVRGIRPGIHGLIAAGPAGYAAFAFETVGNDGFVRRDAGDTRLVMKLDVPGKAAERLPVVLVPPPMVEAVSNSILDYYQIVAPTPLESLGPAPTPLVDAIEVLDAPPIDPYPSYQAPSTVMSGSYGYSSGSQLGGLSGLGVAGAAAAIAIPLATDDDAPGIVVTRDR